MVLYLGETDVVDLGGGQHATVERGKTYEGKVERALVRDRRKMTRPCRADGAIEREEEASGREQG